MIDILNLEPSVIRKDLASKYVLVYGAPKSGKTSIAAQIEGNLILAFERGTNMISGAKIAPIEKWSDAKLILRQLESDEAKAMYRCVTIDTVGIAYDMCSDFICKAHGVKNLSDIEWGKGYAEARAEYGAFLQRLSQLNYGIFLIAHSESKVVKEGEDDVQTIVPALPARAADIINRLVDIIGYIGVEWEDKTTSKRWLITRQQKNILAGSRFKYLPDKIEFSYEALSNAVTKAIEDQIEKDGAVAVDTIVQEISQYNYNDLMEEAKSLWIKLVGDDEKNSEIILNIVEKVTGAKQKISDIEESDVELLNAVVEQMKAL